VPCFSFDFEDLGARACFSPAVAPSQAASYAKPCSPVSPACAASLRCSGMRKVPLQLGEPLACCGLECCSPVAPLIKRPTLAMTTGRAAVVVAFLPAEPPPRPRESPPAEPSCSNQPLAPGLQQELTPVPGPAPQAEAVTAYDAQPGATARCRGERVMLLTSAGGLFPPHDPQAAWPWRMCCSQPIRCAGEPHRHPPVKESATKILSLRRSAILGTWLSLWGGGHIFFCFFFFFFFFFFLFCFYFARFRHLRASVFAESVVLPG